MYKKIPHCCKPNGATGYITELLEGSVSDLDIFDQYSILKQINSGDSVLIDKGFTLGHTSLQCK